LQNIREKADNAEKNDDSDVLFLGRLAEPKNPLFFIDIVSAVVKNIPHLRVAIVGDGELRAEVEAKIKDLELQNNVVLWGFQENPYGLIKNTKVVCMPSVWEGFGLAAVEALILGKPVVASPVGGLKNIVNDECGKLCDSLESYVSAIAELLVDDEMYEQHCIQATKRAEQLDNIEDYKEKILKIYTLVYK
jgi:glycosyltransferase involved in cell wall biosynthesis